MADTTIRTSLGEAIHNHHQEILDTFTKYAAAIVDGEGHADPQAFVTFLKEDLLPHAQGEEVYLYPAVDPLVKAHGSATATMKVDHEFISGYIAQIEEAARLHGTTAEDSGAMDATETTGQPRLSALARLCLQLGALLLVHLEKEERIYIPLFEKYLSEEEQQRILNGMHEAYEPAPDAEVRLLDVREIAPRQRHELIFDTFNRLKPGEVFILANDHDPKPLNPRNQNQ